MKITINDETIEVIIVRKKIKNIYLRFKPDLKLYVSCNGFVSERQILQLINKNQKNICDMYKKIKNKEVKTGTINILGDTYQIIIDENISKVKIEDKYIITPSLDKLDKYYLKEAKTFMTKRFMELSKLFPMLEPSKLRFRKMTSRWGVCNTKLKIITLNTELYKFDASLIDYVIIHELCHYIHPNHSKNFWFEVSKFYPNYKLARKILKEGV